VEQRSSHLAACCTPDHGRDQTVRCWCHTYLCRYLHSEELEELDDDDDGDDDDDDDDEGIH